MNADRNNRPKVIHYRNGKYLPKTATWIYNQVINLKKYDPIVYAGGTDNLDIFPTENIRSLEATYRNSYFYCLDRIFKGIFRFSPAQYIAILKDKPVLIHAHFGPAGYNALALKKIFHLPLITSFYGYDLTRLPATDKNWKERYNKLFNKGDLFLVEGNHMKKRLNGLGCDEDKIIVQHLGTDLNRIVYKPRVVREGNEIRVLIAGSFFEKKGFPYAVEAFGILKKKNPQLNLKLTIIGDSGKDGYGRREKEMILKNIKKYELERVTNMLGLQPHFVFIEELYNNHIFLSPSIHSSDGDTEGGLPVSILEAAASGMVILSTNHCDIPEAVIDGESGFLVPERDSELLARKLEFIACHPEIWPKMGEKGRYHIEKEYNVVTQVNRLEKIYDVALGKEDISCLNM